MKKLMYLLALASVLCIHVSAQSSQEDSPENLRKYVPLLPSVKAQMWKIDPKIGYAVHNVGGGVYVISDNGWQSAFLVTDEGVIVFDAPASFGKSIPSEIAKVTDKPIKMLVYSHAHKDHIGGSAAFKNIKDLRIVSLDTVSDFLKEMNDPNRLVPNETFKTTKTLTLGGQIVELTRHDYHSNEGDLFIYVPQAKFLMAIDSVTAGYAPFQGFDITTNFHEYLKVFDELLAYKFDTFVGGHLTSIGTRQDVEITKEFTMDVYNTVKRVHNNMDQAAVTTDAAKTIGTDNEFLLFKVLLDKVTNDSVKELQPRWINRLAGVDVWLPSHVRTALIYVRWDDKE
jgi:glyoxylase-like metal-dependent hydrolase (beta-lactamase superfamily II)